jgi:hypothetical protein
LLALAFLGGFDDFLGSQAARADANPLVAAVDDRTDRLQIGLEPPRAHVVRMTVLPSDNRTLPAEFTSLRHKTAFSFQRSARSQLKGLG